MKTKHLQLDVDIYLQQVGFFFFFFGQVTVDMRSFKIKDHCIDFLFFIVLPSTFLSHHVFRVDLFF